MHSGSETDEMIDIVGLDTDLDSEDQGQHQPELNDDCTTRTAYGDNRGQPSVLCYCFVNSVNIITSSVSIPAERSHQQSFNDNNFITTTTTMLFKHSLTKLITL